MPFSDMNVLVTNNYFGTPLVWEYNDGEVDRMFFEDFNTHNMLLEGLPIYVRLPQDLFEIIINYVMDIRLKTRNFGQAFDLCTINKRSCFLFYYQIYGRKNVRTSSMLYQLGKTFQLGECLYDEYLSAPNPTGSAFNTVSLTRSGSLQFNMVFDPWDFLPSYLEINRFSVDEDNDIFDSVYMFPGQFHGENIWIHGEETDGVYRAQLIHHPVLLIILRDISNSLIATTHNINSNWLKFANFLRRAFGEKTGFYFMVKNHIDAENPFIESSDHFVRL